MAEYEAKRNFEQTSEPGPTRPEPSTEGLSFVVQRHAASHLHYDFRLELDGVLVSWAVPKGPSLNPHDRRLAVKVEDHPYDYKDFEGAIPQGEYGGGTVEIWDKGTYCTEKAGPSKADQQTEIRRQLDRGKLEIDLFGERLHGSWVVVNTKENQWLLMKRHDEFETSKSSEEQFAGPPKSSPNLASMPKPGSIKPMLLSEVREPFSGKDWSFEVKLDGIRTLAWIEGDQVHLFTRYMNDVTSRFPRIVRDLQRLGFHTAILDGEVVQYDQKGLPNFQNLVGEFKAGTVKTAEYCVFDLLYLDGQDLRHKPWKERRAKMETLGLPQGTVIRVDVYPEDGKVLFDSATGMGFEGIVGKRIDSHYEAGVRSSNWVKIKPFHSEDFVVGGYKAGKGARTDAFGALVLGRQTDVGLHYVGNVGSGFNEAELGDFAKDLKRLEQDRSPFVDAPKIPGVHWVRPDIQVEVKMASWTNEGRLRMPVYLRRRPDLPAATAMHGGGQPKMNTRSTDSEILSALREAGKELNLDVQGHKLHFTNLDKQLWPSVTKRDLLIYLATVADTILPYLKNRPVSFVRCPEGIEGERFFQKHWEKGRPAFVDTVSIYSEASKQARDFLMCNNLPTLLWFGQVAGLELNPWNSRIENGHGVDYSGSVETRDESSLNYPDFLAFDFDPHFSGKGTEWKQDEWLAMVDAAMLLKEILGTLRLKGFPKSSGKTGLHVFVPLAPDYTYDQVRAATQTVGAEIVSRMDGKVTVEWNTKKRPKGVFIDVNQNVFGKTMAGVYSPRAALGAGVSVPLNWDELQSVNPSQFTVMTAAARLEKVGDLWSGIFDNRQHLGA